MKKVIFGTLLVGLFGLFLSVGLISCGGGGGGGSASTSTPTISGTAATGKPLAYVPIYLKDSKGTVRSTITDANGKFSFDTRGLTPPFYLRAEGNLFSYTEQSSGTANITPLTTAVVAIANNGNSDIYTNPPKLNLTNAKNSLKSFLDPVLQKYSVQNVDFITTPFDANGQGMDAVIERILISVKPTNNTIDIEIKNPFTGETIGKGTFANGSISVSNPINSDEVNNLPSSVTFKKYFAYAKNNYGGQEEGPYMVDVVESSNGQISVTITAVDGDTGDLFFIYGKGTKSGNNISFEVALIMCSDTDPNGTGTASFTGTIDSNGNITGTFINTLSPGDTCKENGSSIYEGTWKAEDITNASPANIAGTYNVYATPKGGLEEGPATLTITQTGNSVNSSLTFIDGDTGKEVTRTGKGTVYGAYVIVRIPVIICHDTGSGEAEYATFFGRYENGTITGIYGDGVYPGDSCKNGNAEGTWRAVKK